MATDMIPCVRYPRCTWHLGLHFVDDGGGHRGDWQLIGLSGRAVYCLDMIDGIPTRELAVDDTAVCGDPGNMSEGTRLALRAEAQHLERTRLNIKEGSQ